MMDCGIQELDVVELRRSQAGSRNTVGQKGTVVFRPPGDRAVVTVEFVDRDGRALELLDVPLADLRMGDG